MHTMKILSFLIMREASELNAGTNLYIGVGSPDHSGL